MKRQLLEKQVNRLKVFSFIKKIMLSENRCPIASEVCVAVGLERSAVDRHMLALSKAAGLPMPITSGVERSIEGRSLATENSVKNRVASSVSRAKRGYKEDLYVFPVDEIMTLGFSTVRGREE